MYFISCLMCGLDRYVGKVVYPDWYMASIVGLTNDGIATWSHLSCRTPDRFVVSPVALRILVAAAGSGALPRPGSLQELCRGMIRSVATTRRITGVLQRQDLRTLRGSGPKISKISPQMFRMKIVHTSGTFFENVRKQVETYF